MRTVRRWEERYDTEGAEGLYDQRLGKLELFDTKYWDYTPKHFHEKLVTQKGFTVSGKRPRHGFRLTLESSKEGVRQCGFLVAPQRFF